MPYYQPVNGQFSSKLSMRSTAPRLVPEAAALAVAVLLSASALWSLVSPLSVAELVKVPSSSRSRALVASLRLRLASSWIAPRRAPGQGFWTNTRAGRRDQCWVVKPVVTRRQSVARRPPISFRSRRSPRFRRGML